MITRKCSSDSRSLSAPSAFFRGAVRRAWPKLLCYSLLLFFLLPLPILFEINDYAPNSTMTILERLNRLLTGNIVLYCFAIAALAVFAGMLATRYLTRRASVDYYHSLPLRRETLLLTHWAEGALHVVSALCLNLLLSLAVIATVAEIGAALTAVLVKMLVAFGYMLLVFLLFYTLTVFCGMLCGTSIMQVIVTGLLLGAYPMLRLLVCAFADMNAHFVDVYAMMEAGWRLISPLVRLGYLSGTDFVTVNGLRLYSLEDPFLWWEILLWIAVSILFFVGTLWLYRRRHVERAGTPVVFDGVASAVRWTVVLLGTMSLGWLFMELGDGLFWLFFGFLLGGFLAFILVGTLLTKNPKQMFDGWRRLIAYLLLFCLLFVGFLAAVTALDAWVPKKINRISLYFGGDNYCVSSYDDPEIIEAWQSLRETVEVNEYGRVVLTYAEKEDYYGETLADLTFYFNETDFLPVKVYVEVGGAVIAYQAISYPRSALKPLLQAVADSDEFEAGWAQMLEQVRTKGLQLHDPTEDYNSEMDHIYYTDDQAQLSMYRLFAEVYADLVEMPIEKLKNSPYHYGDFLGPVDAGTADVILSDMDEVDFDYFQSPVYAMVTVPSFRRTEDTLLSNGMPFQGMLYLNLHMTAPSYYKEVTGMTEDELYGAMADQILSEHGGLYVARREKYSVSLTDDCVMQVTDRAQIIEVLRGMPMLDAARGYYAYSPFTVLDEDYGVIPIWVGDSSVIHFIDGKVPAFVKEALG